MLPVTDLTEPSQRFSRSQSKMALCSPLRGVKVPLRFHHAFRRSVCPHSSTRGLAILSRANASGLESDDIPGPRSDFHHGEGEVFVARASSPRLDAFLADKISGVSRSRIVESIKNGVVVVNGHVTTKPSHKLDNGDKVICKEIIAPPPSEVVPEDIPLDVVFEDEHLIIVNKPPGMVVHPSAGHPSGSLVNALLFHCNGEKISKVPRLGVVHRIDKGTSGLLVMAKDAAAQAGLQEQFARRSVRRRYLAIVLGTPTRETGRIDAPIGRDPNDRLRMGIVRGAGGRQAISNFGVRVKLSSGNAALVEWQLETGRTHQIRVHSREMGHPIIGDDTYGGGESAAAGFLRRNEVMSASAARSIAESCARPMLHARSLGFVHPVSGEDVNFAVDPPLDFVDVFTELSKY